jgi:hypothetical protein
MKIEHSVPKRRLLSGYPLAYQDETDTVPKRHKEKKILTRSIRRSVSILNSPRAQTVSKYQTVIRLSAYRRPPSAAFCLPLMMQYTVTLISGRKPRLKAALCVPKHLIFNPYVKNKRLSVCDW